MGYRSEPPVAWMEVHGKMYQQNMTWKNKSWFAQYDQSILCPFQTCSFTLMRLHRSKPHVPTEAIRLTMARNTLTKEDVGNALLQFVSMQFVYHVGHA